MRTRPTPSYATASGPAVSVNIALCTVRDDGLAVMLEHKDAASRWALPCAALTRGERPDAVAARLVNRIHGHAPAWLTQTEAFVEADASARSFLSIGHVGVTPEPSIALANGVQWFSVAALPRLVSRQAAMIDIALSTMRDRANRSPVAFRLLPIEFTLGALQRIYELLLGRQLHKASFRRALRAARLVKPTRSILRDGRGRPARLYRFAPERVTRSRRAVQFESPHD